MTLCDKCQVAIVALFDNEAGDEDLRLAAAHLQDCPGCRAFYLDLVGIRRTLISAPLPCPSAAAGQELFDSIKTERSDCAEWSPKEGPRRLQLRWLARCAAVLMIGFLTVACFVLDRTASKLRTRLDAAEQRVAAIRERQHVAESQERERRAISALYFRMAELERRVDRYSGPQEVDFAERPYGRPVEQRGL